MIQLTKNQQDAMLRLGGSLSFAAITTETLNELILLSLVYKRSDGNLDFTEAGEVVYNKLASKEKRNKK